MLMQPQIIYEDDNVLVVAKPAGMLVHPTVKLEPDTLYGFVKNYYADAHLDLGVHPVFRLDRFTSGLVLFAKQAKVQAQLSGQAVTKEYLALKFFPGCFFCDTFYNKPFVGFKSFLSCPVKLSQDPVGGEPGRRMGVNCWLITAPFPVCGVLSYVCSNRI